MNSDQIRRKFLDFFAAKGHKVVPSDSLVPVNDRSVLFTSAGMNQFKEQFMGNVTDFKRAASSQKCLRTADLVNVGKSPTHHTFFEMLGNFSFGDYFKEEAIQWAWEFVREVLKLPEEKLWVSVHNKDGEAYRIWLKNIGVPKEKIVKLGDNDNFWPANAPKEGPNGPCGPCSEIFYDWGKEFGCGKPDCSPACDCKRFFEIWNLVFTQFDRRPDGALLALPTKNIDTGMGLERITSVVENVRTNYQTDLFVPILQSLKELLKRQRLSPDNDWLNSQANAVADHIRAATFAIADGVVPSNEARGYVIRKLIRRSITYLKQVGVQRPLCFGMVYSIAKAMENAYPEIMRRHETIAGIIKKEEEMFWTILEERTPLTDEKFKNLGKIASDSASAKNKLDATHGELTPAEVAFNLYDTYGVPLEISREFAQKYGHEISEDEFEKLMQKQRERSRSQTQISSEIFAKSVSRHLQGLKSSFIGYEKLEGKSKILAIIKNDESVNQAGENDLVDVVLDVTPFYAESGGQVGDLGRLNNEDKLEAEVEGAVRIDDAILHRVKVLKGMIKQGDMVTAKVSSEIRQATARNHTATHLLQAALREILGAHVEQAGSSVSSEKLRFDFSHLKQLEQATIEKVELLVNEFIWRNLPVKTDVMDTEKAKKSGALAFFQEKYDQKVRVLTIGETSKELCGGTHVKATGEIGLFKIISEGAVAQGIRRIEAVTGRQAFRIVKNSEHLIEELSGLFKTIPEKLVETAEKNLNELKLKNKEIEKLKTGALNYNIENILKNATLIDNISVIIAEFGEYDMNALRKMSDLIREKKDPCICVLGGHAQNKPVLVVALSNSLANKGFDAVKIIKSATALAGLGGGGGKKALAQAGTKDIAGLRKAIDQSLSIVEDFIKKAKSRGLT